MRHLIVSHKFSTRRDVYRVTPDAKADFFFAYLTAYNPKLSTFKLNEKQSSFDECLFEFFGIT